MVIANPGRMSLCPVFYTIGCNAVGLSKRLRGIRHTINVGDSPSVRVQVSGLATFLTLRLIAFTLFEQQVVYVKHITTHSEYDKLCRRYAQEAEYQEALAMVDKLIDDFGNNLALIERLTDAIYEWESAFKEFSELNAGVQPQDAVGMLRFLMDQHGLGVADLPEIGSKSLVSRILNRKGRDLTRRHIKALAKRFG